MKTSEEAKKQYESFRDSGDLNVLFPGMSGEWEKDKRRFTLLWEENQELIQRAEKFYKKG